MKVAVATALLYFWGTVYLSAYATRLGIPFDILSVPIQQVVFAPWEAVEYFVTDTLAFFLLLAIVPFGIRFLSYLGHVISASIAKRPGIQARWAKLHPRNRAVAAGTATSADDEALEGSLRVGLFRAIAAMGVLLLMYAGTEFADSKGKTYAAQRLAKECRLVSVVTSAGTMPGRVEFCARFGDDLVFRVDSGPGLHLVKASDIRSVAVLPSAPTPPGKGPAR